MVITANLNCGKEIKMNDPCPCFGCKDRRADPNCHGTCYDRYIPWTERQETRKEKERIAKKAEDEVVGHIINNFQKIKKSKKWANER